MGDYDYLHKDCDVEKMSRLNVNNLPLSSPFHPPYIDPLYLPYIKRAQGWGPPISPYKKNPSYPLIDNRRLRLGWGNRFRSQVDGITMPDFVMGPNQMGYPKTPDSGYGPFYTNDIYKTYPLANISRSSTEELEKKYQCRDPRAF